MAPEDGEARLREGGDRFPVGWAEARRRGRGTGREKRLEDQGREAPRRVGRWVEIRERQLQGGARSRPGWGPETAQHALVQRCRLGMLRLEPAMWAMVGSYQQGGRSGTVVLLVAKAEAGRIRIRGLGLPLAALKCDVRQGFPSARRYMVLAGWAAAGAEP